jgi:hypothetical protein
MGQGSLTPRALSHLALVAAVLALGSPAQAQLGRDGDPIETSDYTIDLYSGTVQGSARMTGLGGAYVAIAEGVDGNLVNPVAPAFRPLYSVDHFDYWLGFALTAPFSVGDAYNTGGFASEAGFDQSGFTYLAPSVNLQWGPFGVGLTLEAQTTRLDSRGTAAGPDDDARLRFQFLTVRLQAAYQFFDGQLLVGLGGILVVQRALGGNDIFDEKELYVSEGFNWELGALWRPNDQQYRLGVALQGSVDTSATEADTGDDVREGFYLPRGIHKPWELRLGGAYQFGNRPLNGRWLNVDQVVQNEVGDLWDEMSSDAQDLYRKETWRRLRREYRAQRRIYVLLTASLDVVGPTRGAVSVEGFLTQRVQRSGNEVSLVPRWGMETDIYPNWVTFRFGGYVEPSRVGLTNPRGHVTFGLDFKVGWWDVFGIWSEDYLWRVGVSMDAARDYYVGSLGFGGWY